MTTTLNHHSNNPAHPIPQQTDPSSVLHRRVEDLVDIFPDEARTSLAQMAAVTSPSTTGGGGGGGGLVSSGNGVGGSKQDVRYEVPLLAGGRRGRVVKATFRYGTCVAWGLFGGPRQMNGGEIPRPRVDRTITCRSFKPPRLTRHV